MELSAIQIVTTVVLIVAAGAVALFCDYLRSRSQQLQELAVETGTRHDLPASSPAASANVPSAASAAANRISRAVVAPEDRTEPVPQTSGEPADGAVPPPQQRRLERHSAEMVKPALANAAEIASVRGVARPRRRPLPPPNVPLPRLEDMNPRQALSEWLDQRAAKPSVRRAEPIAMPPVVENMPAPLPPSEPLPPSVPIESAPAPEAEVPAPVLTTVPAEPSAIEVHTPAVEEPLANTEDIRDILRRARSKRHTAPAPIVEVEPAVLATPVAVTAAVAAPAPSLQPAPEPVAFPATAKTISVVPKKVSVFLKTREIETFLREEVTASESNEPKPVAAPGSAATETRFEIINGASSSSNSMEVHLPAGMHDRAVLDRAIATGKPFRGLVIAVGVNDVEGHSIRNNDLMQSIGFFIRGLLEVKELACRSGESEFLILCPGLEGSKSQQRLTHIAEQLWDYQLRGVSTWSILFSWGGSDAHYQRLPEAISNASEQMNATRRGRKMVSVETLRPLRKAI